MVAGPGSALVCTVTSDRPGLSCFCERTFRPAASCTSARATAPDSATDTTTAATSPHPRTAHDDSQWCGPLGPLLAGITRRRGLGQRRDEDQRHADLLAAEQPAHAVDAGPADEALLADDLPGAQVGVVRRRQRAGRAALVAARAADADVVGVGRGDPRADPPGKDPARRYHDQHLAVL